MARLLSYAQLKTYQLNGRAFLVPFTGRKNLLRSPRQHMICTKPHLHGCKSGMHLFLQTPPLPWFQHFLKGVLHTTCPSCQL